MQIIHLQVDKVVETIDERDLQLKNITTCAQALAMMADAATQYFPSGVGNGGISMQRCLLKLLDFIGIVSNYPHRLHEERGTLVVATLDLVSSLVARLQCHTLPAEDTHLEDLPRTIISVIRRGLQYASGLSLLTESRWLVSERCTRVLLMCLHAKHFTDDHNPLNTTPTTSMRNSSIFNLRRLVVTVLLKGTADSVVSAGEHDAVAGVPCNIQDFVIEAIEQSVRWISVLDRQFQPTTLQRYAHVMSNVLEITRLVLATPLADLEASGLYPLSSTRLPRRIFALELASVGTTNDDNFSLVDEVCELCDYGSVVGNISGSAHGALRQMSLTAMKLITLLGRVISDPNFGTNVRKEAHPSQSVLGTSLDQRTLNQTRPVTWSLVAAMGGPRAAQLFAESVSRVVENPRVASETVVAENEEETYMAALDLIDAAINSLDGLAEVFVFPRELEVSGIATTAPDNKTDRIHLLDKDNKKMRAFLARLVHAPSVSALKREFGFESLNVEDESQVLKVSTFSQAERFFNALESFRDAQSVVCQLAAPVDIAVPREPGEADDDFEKRSCRLLSNPTLNKPISDSFSEYIKKQLKMTNEHGGKKIGVEDNFDVEIISCGGHLLSSSFKFAATGTPIGRNL